jgi:hypothetical protein
MASTRTNRARPLPVELRALAAVDEETARRDAERPDGLPPDAPARLLHLTAQLPAVTPEVLAALTGTTFGVGRKAVRRLARAGLLQRLYTFALDGTIPESYYLADAGVAELGRALGCDADAIAARYGVDGASLGLRIGYVPELIRRYELAGVLFRCCPGGPRLVGWRRYWPPGIERELSLLDPLLTAMPAWIALRAADTTLQYLLLPDLPSYQVHRPRTALEQRPVHFYRQVLRRVLARSATSAGPVPRILVATESDERLLAWGDLLAGLDGIHSDAPLGVTVACWDDLATALEIVLMRDLLGPDVRIETAPELPART